MIKKHWFKLRQLLSKTETQQSIEGKLVEANSQGKSIYNEFFSWKAIHFSNANFLTKIHTSPYEDIIYIVTLFILIDCISKHQEDKTKHFLYLFKTHVMFLLYVTGGQVLITAWAK